MTYKIAHLADVHIKNLKYHYEYRHVFNQLYAILRKNEVDYIYIGGDIAHTKTQISPEFVQLCSEFFTNLANIASHFTSFWAITTAICATKVAKMPSRPS